MKQINYEAAVKSLKTQAKKIAERLEFHAKKEQENKFFKDQFQQQLDFLNAQIERLSSPTAIEPMPNKITEHELANK